MWIKQKNNNDLIFITDDENEILSLIDMDVNTIAPMMFEEFYEYLYASNRIRISKFFKCNTTHSHMLVDFANFLEGNPQLFIIKSTIYEKFIDVTEVI